MHARPGHLSPLSDRRAGGAAPAVPPGSFGPQLAALVSLLPGRYRLSICDLACMLEEQWHVPMRH